MTNKEAIDKLVFIRDGYIELLKNDTRNGMCLVGDMIGVWEADNSLRDKYVSFIAACEMAIKALEKDKCSSCKHYDKDYGETCLNPEGTCRVFEYDGYEEEENVSE